MAYDADVADRVRELLAGERDLTEKKMFGGLAFLVAGRMRWRPAARGASWSELFPRSPTSLRPKQ